MVRERELIKLKEDHKLLLKRSSKRQEESNDTVAKVSMFV